VSFSINLSHGHQYRINYVFQSIFVSSIWNGVSSWIYMRCDIGTLGEATIQTTEAAREIAANTGVPEQAAVTKAAGGALQAAEVIGREGAVEVVEVFASRSGTDNERYMWA
jgi:hypothetical protein